VVDAAKRHGASTRPARSASARPTSCSASRWPAAAGWARSIPPVPTSRPGMRLNCRTTGFRPSRCPQGPGRLGPLAGPLPVAAVQLLVHPRRLARSLRLPHQLHRRVGRPHVRPVSGGPQSARHLAGRVRIREEPHRRRHGHEVRQRRQKWSCTARAGGTGRAGCGSRGPKGGSRPRTTTSSRRCQAPRCSRTSTRSVKDYMERTSRPMNHMRNFLDCVRNRKPTVANAEVMFHSMSTVHAANICMWLKRNMKVRPRQEGVRRCRRERLPFPAHAGTLGGLTVNSLRS